MGRQSLSDELLRIFPQDVCDAAIWAVWDTVERDGRPTKLAFRPDGKIASANRPADWSRLSQLKSGERVCLCPQNVTGLVIADLDNCRDPETEELTKWAQEIVEHLRCYWEVSPSGTGLRGIMRGHLDLDFHADGTPKTGRVYRPADLPIEGINPSLRDPEIAFHTMRHYFTVTGQPVRLDKTVWDEDHSLALRSLICRLEKAKAERKLDAKLKGVEISPAAERACLEAMLSIKAKPTENDGSKRLYAVCCRAMEFGLREPQAVAMVRRYSEQQPFPVSWSDDDIARRYRDAVRNLGDRFASAVADRPRQNVRYIPHAEALATNVRKPILIPHVLNEGQPLVIGGPKKCLKTSLMLDLAISLDQQLPFLNCEKYTPRQRKNVWVISAESGQDNLLATTNRICRERGIDHAKLGIGWAFQAPNLNDEAVLDDLAAIIENYDVEILVLDPVYLMMLQDGDGDAASNVFSMGARLASINALCNEVGCQPILAHHTRKLGPQQVHEPLDLDQLSFVGFAEFARQWILVNRRRAYESGTGRHELWMRIESSSGFSSLLALDVYEGPLEFDDEGYAKDRQFAIESLEEVSDITAWQLARSVSREQENAMAELEDLIRVMASAGPLTQRGVRELAAAQLVDYRGRGWGHSRTDRTLAAGVDAGRIVKTEQEIRGRSRMVYTVVPLDF